METGHNNRATVTVLPLRSTAELDLANLPERLNDQQLAMVEAIAREPLPELPPCGEGHFARCLRVMLSVLPKQNTDEIGGELFVATYHRQLGAWPDAAISHLADEATKRCRWFPTIAECLDILSGWHRNDDAVSRRLSAITAARRERDARIFDLESKEKELEPITQGMVDVMPESLRRIGLSQGWLVKSDTGTVSPAPDAA